jgi:hypothetical protein
MNAAGYGLTSAAADTIAHSFLYSQHDSFDIYSDQKAKVQGDPAAWLLRNNVDQVVSEHKKRGCFTA